MHVRTNTWSERRTGYRYVGCIGYDDPVYESYTYTEHCSDEVIVFDFTDERVEYFNSVRSVKGEASRLQRKLTSTLKEQAIAEYDNEISCHVADYEAKLKAVCDHNNSLMNRNWIVKLFLKKSLPKTPKFVDSRSPFYRTFEDGTVEILDVESRFNNLVGQSDELKQVKLILSYPDDIRLFIDKVYKDDYLSIMKFISTSA
jgi:hypothetical protein